MAALAQATTRPRRSRVRERHSFTLAAVGSAAWYFLGIALALGLVVYALGRVRLLVVALFAAMAFTTIVSPAVRWLERHHVPTLVATWLAFLVALGVFGLLVFGVVSVTRDEFRGLDGVVVAGVDDVEAWLVEGPLSLDETAVNDLRSRASREFIDLAGGGSLVSGARSIAEGLTGTVLALALAFFLVKDGPLLQRRLLHAVPPPHRGAVRAAGRAAWNTLVGYVRAMALIGLVEGLAMTVALAAVGVDLALPIGILTVLCAFLPFVGAVLAGVVAVLAALVTGGAGDAAVIALFALLLQQFDNELLAPVVYGRMTRLHPVVVLASVAGGAGIAGLAGAVLAVPIVATAAAAAGHALRSLDDAAKAAESR